MKRIRSWRRVVRGRRGELNFDEERLRRFDGRSRASLTSVQGVSSCSSRFDLVPPAPPINSSFPSSGSSLPFSPHTSHLGASSSHHELPPDASHPSNFKLNQEDVYILIDRTPSSPTKRETPHVVRELTLSAKELKSFPQGRLEPRLRLRLACPTTLDRSLPSSFTTFEAIERPDSPILQLSPSSQHRLIFHFPPRSFTLTPNVDFGSGHWWRNQVCRGVVRLPSSLFPSLSGFADALPIHRNSTRWPRTAIGQVATTLPPS